MAKNIQKYKGYELVIFDKRNPKKESLPKNYDKYIGNNFSKGMNSKVFVREGNKTLFSAQGKTRNDAIMEAKNEIYNIESEKRSN